MGIARENGEMSGESNSLPVPPGLDPEDFYYEGPYLVFTAAYHLKRGNCCGSGCRHCPWRELDSEPALTSPSDL